MKRAKRWTWLFSIAVIMTTALPPAWGAPPAAPDPSTQAVSLGYLENVTFEKLPGKERVTLAVSKQSGVTVENQPGNALLVRLENLYVPEGLRRPLDDASLANVIRLTPVQKSAAGRSWVLVTIELRQKVPYSVRQEGMNVVIDFNVTSLALVAGPEQAMLPPSAQSPVARQAPLAVETASTPAKGAAKDTGREKKVYTGSRIFLDVQGADIKAVFRLLAEQGNVSIVAGDDVKGTVTLNMKDVPWDEALDTILRVHGLDKARVGNIITVMTLENLTKQQALERSRRDVEPQVTKVIRINYAKAVDLQKNLQEFLNDKEGKPRGSVRVDEHSNSLIIQALPDDIRRITPIIEEIDKQTSQILIKANIVETTKDFARSLGIQWGGVFGRHLGDNSLYVTPGGTAGSATAPGSALSGQYTPSTGTTGISGQGFGVNFPAAAIDGTAAASLGLIFGTIGGNLLELQLSALQKDGKLNILSSPSLTTLDNQKAVTENGEEIPVTTVNKDGEPSTAYKPVTLKMDITPHVIDGRTLKMSIMVQKDEIDLSRVDQYGNPYIIKKQTTTSLIVRDGETIVISGLSKQKTSGTDTGIPLFKDIPILGWLFKSEGKSSRMEEVLIFITPNILKPQTVSGIQDGPGDSMERPAPPASPLK
jgi:type IV pilus assembly protein PilQ